MRTPLSSRADHVEPPYGEAEVEQAEGRLVAAGYGQTVTVRDLELTLFPAGHILGAAGVVIRAGDQRVVITGDIDDRGQASVGPAQIPPRPGAWRGPPRDRDDLLRQHPP